MPPFTVRRAELLQQIRDAKNTTATLQKELQALTEENAKLREHHPAINKNTSEGRPWKMVLGATEYRQKTLVRVLQLSG